MLAVLVERQQVRDWYTTKEFAQAVGARYAVALNSGLRLVAHVPGSRSHFAEGSEVHLSWAPDRIWILPPEKEGD